MGVPRDVWHQRRRTGAPRKPRGQEPGRPAAQKTGPRRPHPARGRRGSTKRRAGRRAAGSGSRGSERRARGTRAVEVARQASSRELGRTRTPADSRHPQGHESRYPRPRGGKKGARPTPEEEEEETGTKKRSRKMQKKYDGRKRNARSSRLLQEQIQQDELLAGVASPPGRCGPAEGHGLPGKELEL